MARNRSPRIGNPIIAISWVGIRTDNLMDTRRFFEKALGMKVEFEALDFVVLRTPAGDTLEIFGPRARLSEPEQFTRNQVVVGLLVEDIDKARREIEAAGAMLLGGLQRTPDGGAWQHFRGPDGNTWELVHDPHHPVLRRT